MVGIAQLVEHLVVVQGAAGSSPVTHPQAKAICVRGERGAGRLRHICTSLRSARGRGFATHTP
jgi:hypothetical protein